MIHKLINWVQSKANRKNEEVYPQLFIERMLACQRWLKSAKEPSQMMSILNYMDVYIMQPFGDQKDRCDMIDLLLEKTQLKIDQMKHTIIGGNMLARILTNQYPIHN